MVALGIESIIESLSEAVIFLESDDLNGLANLHGLLGDVGTWATESGRTRTAIATQRACSLLEKIILNETSDPPHALKIVADTISSLQRVTRAGMDDGQVEFPADLDVPKLVNGSARREAEAEQASTQPRRAVTVVLPPYVDETIFAEFLARQDGVLEEVETAILSLEHGPNPEAQGILARHLHTLKGETALLGLSELEHLCHAAEDVIERETATKVADRLLSLKDWFKQSFDAFAGKGEPPFPASEMMDTLQGNPTAEEKPVAPSAPAAAQRPPAPAGRLLSGDKELIADFVIEAAEHLDASDIQLLSLEVDPGNQDAIDAVFRAFHTIKGVCGFIDLGEMQALAHESENLLDQARRGQIVLQGPYLDGVFDAIDMLKRLLGFVREALENNTELKSDPELDVLIQSIADLATGKPPAAADAPDATIGTRELVAQLGGEGKHRNVGEILMHMGAVTPDVLEEALALQDESLSGTAGAPHAPIGEVLIRQGEVEPRQVALALRTQKELRQTPPGSAAASRQGRPAANGGTGANSCAVSPGLDSGGIVVRETVRVDAARLDQLVDMIGELVIAESMVCQSKDLVGNVSAELSRQVSQLDKITRELQEMATGLRMVPVRSTFQKMARLVRDVAKKTGKEVSFTMQGEDTELDKTVVDRISDPLVHMIRNAVDHGLEDSGAERRAAGKPPAGMVTLRAYHSGGNIQIEIADDGRGLDRDAILRKAKERSLIADNGESLPNKSVWQLIFEPGFSTAKQLTEVSGRGVGMDVVRRNIEELRGEIDIDSERGKGSRFTIRLPLTLAIIDGMVVRVGAERFIIPTLSIVVSVRPRASDLGTVAGVAETMRLHGDIIPLFRLYSLFDIPGAVVQPAEGTVVVLENGGKRVGLLIDQILGQQQIVIKSLGPSLRGAKGIAGGAIMPDGRVGLIVDIGELVKLATEVAPA